MWAVILSGIDTCFRRLPDVFTVPAIVAVTVWAVSEQPWWLLGGVAWAGIYLVLPGFGGGDIKLAASLGVVAAANGVLGWCVAVGGASLVTVVVGVATGQRVVAHGPGMLAATFGVCLCGF
ncbi:MAG: A24 family peptidase [Corynebacterium sp.]|nr:A24 family peptidase [Corynebacterium sp.]MDO5077534.1 A24 family peptidase [Corynebacterium sp.]